MALTIRREQLDQLDAQFETRYILDVLQRNLPHLYRSLRAGLGVEFADLMRPKLTAHAIESAFAKEHLIVFFAIFGAHADEDLLKPEPATILSRTELDILRMLDLKQWSIGFRDAVYGADYEHYLTALHQVLGLDERILANLNTEDALVTAGRHLFPTLATRLPAGAERTLFRFSSNRAQAFATAEPLFPLICILYGCCLFLGTGCLDDPLHDFIRKTLRGPSPTKAIDIFRYAQKRARAEVTIIERHQQRSAPCH